MLLFFVFYLIIGFFAGVFSGLIGVGGGLIVVPALAWIYTLQGFSNTYIMHLAAGTSLAAMIFSIAASMKGHYQRGFVTVSIFKRMVFGIVVGTILGVLLASILHTRILEMVFGVMVIFIAILLLVNIRPPTDRILPNSLALTGASSVIGIFSGLLGLGGGAVTVPYLAYCNVPLRNAIGVSTAVGLLVAIIGTVSFIIAGINIPDLPAWSTGYIYWPAVLGIALVSPFSATLGVYLSHRLPVNLLRKIFAVFLIMIGLKMLF